MTLRTGAGPAAVLFAALSPTACMQTITLERHPATGGTGGGTAALDGGPDANGADRDASTDRDMSCPPGSVFSQVTSHRVVPSIFIALDHSTSMSSTPFSNNNRSRLNVVQNALRDPLTRYAQIIRFGYIEFPGVPQGHSCSMMNGCCVGSVSQPINDSEVGILDAIDRCGGGASTGSGCINTEATPTTLALSTINDTYTTLGSPSSSPTSRYTLLITDGEPSCPMGMGSIDPCSQSASEIGKLNLAGIPTFVIGVGDIPGFTDSAGANACLNDLATAGGVTRSNKSPFYYPASNENGFDGHLATVVEKAACHIEIDNETTAPGRMQIDIVSNNNNGGTNVTSIAHDPTLVNGWEFEGTSITKIAFHGQACQSFLDSATSSGQKLRVEGCLPR